MKINNLLFLIAISVGITITSAYLGHEMIHYFAKPISTILVLLIPLFIAKNTLKPYKNLIIIGLVFCLFGDVFLMFDSLFIFGLLSFLIGHIFFLYAFTTIYKFQTKLVTLIPLVLFAGLMFIILKDHLGDLQIPVVVYISFIVLMAWQALNLYVLKKEYGFLLITIGAILFLISDSILSYGKFISEFQIGAFLVAITYWSAITSIALSTLYIDKKIKL